MEVVEAVVAVVVVSCVVAVAFYVSSPFSARFLEQNLLSCYRPCFCRLLSSRRQTIPYKVMCSPGMQGVVDSRSLLVHRTDHTNL